MFRFADDFHMRRALRDIINFKLRTPNFECLLAQDIRAHRALHRRLQRRLSETDAALPTGNENDGKRLTWM